MSFWSACPPALDLPVGIHTAIELGVVAESTHWPQYAAHNLDLREYPVGRALRIERIPYGVKFYADQLRPLFDYCAEERCQGRTPVTLSYDIAKQTIEFLKETN